jgi:flavin-dependent dehydrogenase
MSELEIQFDVVVIGAGPAGTVAAALLEARGYRVQIIEKQHFPRFSIGESLLPYCMEFLEEAGLLEAVKAAASEHHFQFKNGAAFVRGEEYSDFNFQRKFSEGPGTTYQVQRASFDHVLAKAVEARGVGISWGHEIVSVDLDGDNPVIGTKDEEGNEYSITTSFVLDASGFGRVLPKLLELDRPSNFPSRTSLFTHIEDNFPSNEFDREKIRVTIHHQHQDVWFWLIPFSNGRCSLGVVAKSEYFEQFDSSDPQACLRQIIDDEPSLKELLRHANFDTPARMITAYSCDVSRLWGDGFALLGNAGEFLDPVFSSGVTIAMKSAKLAVETLDKQLKGQQVDWQAEYAEPLSAGVNTFRVFVEAWYDGRFQDIIFAENKSAKIEEMISSILAGYAWDEANPYVKESERRMNTLAELCRLS